MASKAKSGMSAVRMFPETIQEPPNSFSTGDPSFATKVRDGKGHAAIHASVSNNTPGLLEVRMAWRSTGPFVRVYEQATAVDPVTGLSTAEISCPVIRRYIQVVFTPPAPGLGIDFEMGAYFLPRADSPCFEISGGVPAPPSSIITGITQVQNIETVVPLAAGATFVGAARNCINFESFGISVFLDPAAGVAISATALVENSSDGGATFRQVDSTPLVGAVDATVQLNRVYSVTRQHYRVSITNNDGVNAMDATELISMQKPI